MKNPNEIKKRPNGPGLNRPGLRK